MPSGRGLRGTVCLCYTSRIMKAQSSVLVSKRVLDSECPWKLPRLDWKFGEYPYKLSPSEWRAFEARAEQGDAEAECEVAWRYEDGCKDRSGRILVKRSARRALVWFRRSAEHGFAPAQENLGVHLSRPGANETSRSEAIAWFKKAYRGGGSCAATNLAITYRESGDLRRAVYWFRNSIAAGDDGDRVDLGIHYYWGKGVRTDHAAAVRLFRKATPRKNMSEADRDDAFFYLGVAYFEGKGVKRSLRIANRLLQRANIDNDHPAAFRLLSQIKKISTGR